MWRNFSLNYLGDIWTLHLAPHAQMAWRLEHSGECWATSRYPTTDMFPADGMLQLPGVALGNGVLKNFNPVDPDELYSRANFPFLGELLGFPVLVVEYNPMADYIIAYPDTPDGNRDYMTHLAYNSKLSVWNCLFRIRGTQERFMLNG